MTTSSKAKNVKRKYFPRGTRRDSATIRIDNEVRQDLKELSERLGMPVIEVMRLAVERLKNEEKQTF